MMETRDIAQVTELPLQSNSEPFHIALSEDWDTVYFVDKRSDGVLDLHIGSFGEPLKFESVHFFMPTRMGVMEIEPMGRHVIAMLRLQQNTMLQQLLIRRNGTQFRLNHANLTCFDVSYDEQGRPRIDRRTVRLSRSLLAALNDETSDLMKRWSQASDPISHYYIDISGLMKTVGRVVTYAATDNEGLEVPMDFVCGLEMCSELYADRSKVGRHTVNSFFASRLLHVLKPMKPFIERALEG